MDTDERPDLHRGGESKLILKSETEKIIGFAFDVLNEVGPGLNEKTVYYKTACWFDCELQKTEARVRAGGFMKKSVFIRVYPW